MISDAISSRIQPLMEQLDGTVRTELASVFEQCSKVIAEQQEHIREQQRRIAILEEHRRLEALARFASKADRIAQIHPSQLELLANEPGLTETELDAVVDQPAEEKKKEAPAVEAMAKSVRYLTKPHAGRGALPAHLRRVDILIDEPPAPLPDGTLPRELRRDVTERLAMVPAEYYVERITTVSYCYPGNAAGGVHHGAAPASLLPKSVLGPMVVIAMTVSKYADHQPVYRQVMALQRDHGIEISYPTADRAVITTAGLATYIADAQLEELIAGDYIQADETRIQVMDRNVKGKTATGYLWTYSHPKGQVVYRYHPGRGGKHARDDLRSFKGWLQSDGYQVYQSIAGLFGEDVKHCACMAHVRRKFVEIVRANRDAAGFSVIVDNAAALVARIDELYGIERKMKEKNASAEEREAERAERSLPLFDALMSEMNRVAMDPDLLPGSGLSRACAYALRLRSELRRSFINGVTEIDNNRCEQSIRPVALGRKNWLHVGSQGAAPSGAAIMSLVESCKRMGINPRNYLEDVLPQLAAAHPDKVAELAKTLTPTRWQAARASVATAA